MTQQQLRPWQVWWVDFNPQVGHEQAGLRPAVVISTAFEYAARDGCAVSTARLTTDEINTLELALKGIIEIQ